VLRTPPPHRAPLDLALSHAVATYGGGYPLESRTGPPGRLRLGEGKAEAVGGVEVAGLRSGLRGIAADLVDELPSALDNDQQGARRLHRF